MLSLILNKGYKCYNPQTKHVRVSHDAMFDESASLYQPPTNPTPIDSMPNSEDEASEANMIEEEIATQEESPRFCLANMVEC